MANIKSSDNVKCCGEWKKTRSFFFFFSGGMEKDTATMENSLAVCYKIKHSISI